MSNVANQTYINDGESKTHAIISYVWLALGLFTGIPMIIGGIWSMVKRKSAIGTIYHSHYSNSIRIFWWSLLWTIVGGVLVFVVVGWAILAIAWLWALYRVVDGFAKITSDTPYPL